MSYRVTFANSDLDPMDGLASSMAAVLVTPTVAAEFAKYPKFFGAYPGVGSAYLLCGKDRGGSGGSGRFMLDTIRVDITVGGVLGVMKFKVTRNGVQSGEISSVQPDPNFPRDPFRFDVGEAILTFGDIDGIAYDQDTRPADAVQLVYQVGWWIQFTGGWSFYNSLQRDPITDKPLYNLPHIPPRFTTGGGFPDNESAGWLETATNWIDADYSPFELNDPLGVWAPPPPDFVTDTLAAAAVGQKVLIETALPVVGFWQVGTVVTDGDFFLPLPLTAPIPGATRATTSPTGYVSPIPVALQRIEVDETIYTIVAKTSDGRYWFSSKPPTSPPWDKVLVTIGTAGALGTMDFVATVNGRSWPSGSTTANHSGSFEFQVPGVGLKLLFAAGTYAAGSTYTVDSTPLVSLSPTAINTVTIESFNLGGDSEFWVSSLTTISARSPGDPSLVEVSPGSWRYCVAQ